MLKKSCKNVLVGAMLLASLAMLLNGCGSDKQAAATQPKTTKVEEAAAAVAKVPAYEREYGKLVEGIYNFVNDGNMDKVPQQGMTGIYELRDHMGYVDALNMLGYTLQDINNDKVPELIFAILDNEKQGKGYYGKDIYAIYTFVDGKIKFVDEGWARSNIKLLANNMFLTRGNSSNTDYVLVLEDLLPNGNKRCVDMYFTRSKSNNEPGLDVYRNDVGRADVAVSQKTNMTADDFFDMGTEMAGDSVKLELLPLKEYKQRGFKGLAMQYLECMGIHELQDAKVDLSKYEQVSVPNPFKGADVIFRSTKNLEEFRLLELASGKSVYSKDLLMADEKLVLHLESLETIPKNGFSFKDDAGRERRFAILQSGKDGSIYLQEID
ncbi:MAG: hypothetical protein ACLUUD_01225 [Phascolarctobacterium succinatutens]|uniref:hypothetical protein n=1 Tax=Phascolarctobacterium succinatutens TaxID=626940 RepID=UPI0026ECECA2|nr:hypothetical protein [Phascolarctobacterium succinatutens]